VILISEIHLNQVKVIKKMPELSGICVLTGMAKNKNKPENFLTVDHPAWLSKIAVVPYNVNSLQIITASPHQFSNSSGLCCETRLRRGLC